MLLKDLIRQMINTGKNITLYNGAKIEVKTSDYGLYYRVYINNDLVTHGWVGSLGLKDGKE